MDGSTRPGNPDTRGWNDPPMFNFSAKTQASPRSNLLNKRVAPPQQQTPPQAGTKASPSLNARMASAKFTPTEVSVPPMTTPPNGNGPPVVPSVPPAATCPSSDPTASQDVDTSLKAVDRIKTVLKECEYKLQKRIFDDITKRLGILSDKWTSGNLPNSVEVRMSNLSHALVDYQYDEAFKIHLTLMVDHMTDVSQWMVGIKRLIQEAKTIRPKPAEVPSEEVNEPLTKDETHPLLFYTKTLQSSQSIKETAEEIAQEKTESDDIANLSKTTEATTEQGDS